MRIFFTYLVLIFIIAFSGCESEKDSNQDKSPVDQTNGVPKNFDNSQQQMPDIEIMTEFTPEQTRIKNLAAAVIYRNLDATQAEDVEGVMETIDSEGPQVSSTIKGMEYVFKNYDMKYEIENLQFISVSDEVVEVLYTQTTKAIKGSGFVNTRSTGIHVLKKTKDGKWKIFETKYLTSVPIQ